MLPRPQALLILAAFTAGCPGRGPDCSDGQVLDGEQCVPAACGVGPWGSLPEQAVHVSAGAAPGGDGTREAPLQTIADALEAAADGQVGIVALAAGRYPEALALDDDHDGLSIAGRCADLVEIDGDGVTDRTATVESAISGGSAAVSGVTLTGGDFGGVFVSRGTLRLSDVVVADNVEAGLWVEGNSATLETDRVTVRGTRSNAAGDQGSGAVVQGGGTLLARDTALVANRWVGLRVRGSTTEVVLEDVEIRDTVPSDNGFDGIGIAVSEGAHVRVTRGTLANNTRQGVVLDGTGTLVEIDDSRIEGTVPGLEGTMGYGLRALPSATARLTNTVLDGNHSGGVVAAGAGAVVELVDCEISGTRHPPETTQGVGLIASDGGLLRATDTRVTDSEVIGIASLSGGTVELLRVAVRGVVPSPTDSPGEGILVDEGGLLAAVDCTLTGALGMGVAVNGTGSRASFDGTTVADTGSAPDGTGGFGLQVLGGGHLELHGGVVRGNHTVGIYAGGAQTTLELTDTRVEDTEPDTQMLGGYGVVVRSGAHATIDGGSIADNRATGLSVSDAGTVVTTRGLRVEGTRRPQHYSAGVGVTVELDAVLEATDLTVQGTEGPGLYVAYGDARCTRCALVGNRFAGAALSEAGALSLTDSTVTDNLSDDELGGGAGVFARGGEAWSAVALSGTTVGPHPRGAVWLDTIDRAHLVDSELDGGPGIVTTTPAGSLVFHGHALYAEGTGLWDGAGGLWVEDVALASQGEATVLLHGATGTFSGGSWTSAGRDVVWQSCASLSPPEGVDGLDTALCPPTMMPMLDRLDLDVRFGEDPVLVE